MFKKIKRAQPSHILRKRIRIADHYEMPAHDASGQDPHDLPRHDQLAAAIDPHLVALVVSRRVVVIRGKEPAWLVYRPWSPRR